MLGLSRSFIRFVVCGVSMAIIGLLLVFGLNEFDFDGLLYFFFYAQIYLFVSILNFYIQKVWVFRKSGKYALYLLASIFCSVVFASINYFFSITMPISSHIYIFFSYCFSLFIVTPFSYALNRMIFKGRI